MQFVYSNDSVTCFVNGKPEVVHSSHQNYNMVIKAIKSKDWDAIPNLINVAKAVANYTTDVDGVVVVNGEVLYHGEPMHNALTNKILDMMDQGFDIEPMILFLGNLMDNPSRTAVQELYLFMESGDLPITEDGHILAYKKVAGDYLDIYSSTMDNSIGQVLSIPRNEVDDVRDNTCSYGLHFCSYSYLSSYGGRGSDNRVVIVKINPSDVVSIPSDYSNAKGRTCRYEVVGEVEDWYENESLAGTTVSSIGCDVEIEPFETDCLDSWDDDDLEDLGDWNEDTLLEPISAVVFQARSKMRNFIIENEGYVTGDAKKLDESILDRLYDSLNLDDEDDIRWFAIKVDTL